MRIEPITSRFVLFALVGAAAGCASAGSRALTASPVQTTAWSTTVQGVTTSDTGDLSRWWERLGDATLTELIDRAVADSPTIHIAQARLRQSRAQREQAAAALWPTVSAGGSAATQRSGNRVFSEDGSSTVTRNSMTGSYGASIDASWEPDIFGGTRRGIDAASADLLASEATLHGAHVSLAAEVAVTYGELRALQARLDIARRNEQSQAETLELTAFREQAGLVGSLDVEQARASVEQTRAQIPSLEASIAQATYRLATLAGAEPGSLTARLSAPAPLPAVPDSVAVAIPAETLRQRPDVRAAEQTIVAETARLDQSRRQQYPRFSLSGTVGLQVLTGAVSGGTTTMASLAANAMQTLFDHGRIRQQIAIQSAIQEQAVASYEATVLTALEEVENSLVSMEMARVRLQSLVAARAAAETAALLARSQYSAGLTDFQTVLITERSILTLQESVAMTEGDRLTALIQLYKALGGGWSPAATATALSGATS